MGIEPGGISPTPSDFEAVKGKEKEASLRGGRLYQDIFIILEGSGKIDEKLKKIAELEANLDARDLSKYASWGVDFIVKQTDPDKKQFSIYFFKENSSDIEQIDIQIEKHEVHDAKTGKLITDREIDDLATKAHTRADKVREALVPAASREAAQTVMGFLDRFSSETNKSITRLYGAVISYPTWIPKGEEEKLTASYQKAFMEFGKQVKAFLEHEDNKKAIEMLLGPPEKRTQESYDKLKNMLFEMIAPQITRHPLFEKIGGVKFNEEKQKYKRVGGSSPFYENLMYYSVVQMINRAVETAKPQPIKYDESWAAITMQAFPPDISDISKQKYGRFSQRLQGY